MDAEIKTSSAMIEEQITVDDIRSQIVEEPENGGGTANDGDHESSKFKAQSSNHQNNSNSKVGTDDVITGDEECPIEVPPKFPKGTGSRELRPLDAPSTLYCPEGYIAMDGMWLQSCGTKGGQASGPPNERDEMRFGVLPFKLNQLVRSVTNKDEGRIVSKSWSSGMQQWCYKVDWDDKEVGNGVYQFSRHPETILQAVPALERVIPESKFKSGTTGRRRSYENEWTETECVHIKPSHIIVYKGKPYIVIWNDAFNKGVWAVACDDEAKPLEKVPGVPLGPGDSVLIYYELFDDRMSPWTKHYLDLYFHLSNVNKGTNFPAKFFPKPVSDQEKLETELGSLTSSGGTVKSRSKKREDHLTKTAPKRTPQTDDNRSTTPTDNKRRKKGPPVFDQDTCMDEVEEQMTSESEPNPVVIKQLMNDQTIVLSDHRQMLEAQNESFVEIKNDIQKEIHQLTSTVDRLVQHEKSKSPTEQKKAESAVNKKAGVGDRSNEKKKKQEKTPTTPVYDNSRLAIVKHSFGIDDSTNSYEGEQTSPAMPAEGYVLSESTNRILESDKGYAKILFPKDIHPDCQQPFDYEGDPIYGTPMFVNYAAKFERISQCLHGISRSNRLILAALMFYSTVDLDKYFALPLDEQIKNITQRMQSFVESSPKNKQDEPSSQCDKLFDDEASDDGTLKDLDEIEDISSGEESVEDGESGQKERIRRVRKPQPNGAFGETAPAEFESKFQSKQFSVWEHLDRDYVMKLVADRTQYDAVRIAKDPKVSIHFLMAKMVHHMWPNRVPQGYRRDDVEQFRGSFRRCLELMRVADKNWKAQLYAAGSIRWVRMCLEVLINSGLPMPSGPNALYAIVCKGKDTLTKIKYQMQNRGVVGGNGNGTGTAGSSGTGTSNGGGNCSSVKKVGPGACGSGKKLSPTNLTELA